MTSSIVINSIQSLIDHRYQLRASCHSCRHHVVLDLNRLGKQLGFDHSTLHGDLVPKLKCSRCESCGLKAIGLTLSYNGQRQTKLVPRGSE